MTRREQELADIKAAEAKTVSDYQGTATRRSYAPGVSFPITESALEALSALTKSKDERSSNFVSLVSLLYTFNVFQVFDTISIVFRKGTNFFGQVS